MKTETTTSTNSIITRKKKLGKESGKRVKGKGKKREWGHSIWASNHLAKHKAHGGVEAENAWRTGATPTPPRPTRAFQQTNADRNWILLFKYILASNKTHCTSLYFLIHCWTPRIPKALNDLMKITNLLKCSIIDFDHLNKEQCTWIQNGISSQKEKKNEMLEFPRVQIFAILIQDYSK